MMLKEKSSPWARLKYLYVLPVAAIAVTAFARPEISETTKEISAVKVNDLAAIVETKVAENVNAILEAPQANTLRGDTAKPAKVQYIPTEVKENLKGKVFDVVEQMPEFPGGLSAFMKYLQDNMRYPESAKKAGVQGRVIVQFVVEEDGSIKNPGVVRSLDKDLDAEAIRLISVSPKWESGKQRGEPVAVKYMVPVVFKLDGKNAEENGTVISHAERLGQAAPLYIVDGMEVSSAVMGALKPDAIESMSVLKDDAATKVYGDKGKNGVVLITLKNNGATVVGVSANQNKSVGYRVSNTKTISKSDNNAGVSGIYISGSEGDMENTTIYVDKVKIDLKGRKLEDVIPGDQIESISVHKSASVENGKDKKGSEIYITTKKNAKASEKTSDKGNMKVEGLVTDAQGEAVVGASVLIEGTTTGTITNVDGRFVLSVPNKDAMLVVSYINMATVKAKASSTMKVVLKDE